MPDNQTAGSILMEKAYEVYQASFGNLTQREEDANRKAFCSGWHARDRLSAMARAAIGATEETDNGQ